jgi:hypothetical protein
MKDFEFARENLFLERFFTKNGQIIDNSVNNKKSPCFSDILYRGNITGIR